MTFPLLLGARQDHGLHRGKAILFHEHVLRTTQADALRPKLSAFGRILRVVRISTNTQSSNCVRPLKYLFKIFIDLRWDQFSLAQDDSTSGAIHCDPIAFLNDNVSYHEPPCLSVYVCLLYTSPSPRDGLLSRMPSSA